MMKNDILFVYAPEKTPIELILNGHQSACVSTDAEGQETIVYDAPIELDLWWEKVLPPLTKVSQTVIRRRRVTLRKRSNT